MKQFIASILCAVSLFCYGCGSGSDFGSASGSISESCDFNINAFANGSSSSTVTSYWKCYSEGYVDRFAFFTDGTGVTESAGPFTWAENGCRSVRISDANGDYLGVDFDGSMSSGIMTFTQRNEDGTEYSISCELWLL